MNERMDVFAGFVGKEIEVQGFGVTASGVLIGRSTNVSRPHIPEILVLQNEQGKVLIRVWSTIGTKEVK